MFANTGILSAASAVPKTGSDVYVPSMTANGFFAFTVTASARCWDSSSPLEVTKSRSNVRPYVTCACVNAANVSLNAFVTVPVFPVVWSTGVCPGRAPASCCSFGTSTTTLILSFVTPCDVAPPLSVPFFHSATQTGPKPSKTKSVRPYGPASLRHCGLAKAAAVFIPVPAGGLPFPAPGWLLPPAPLTSLPRRRRRR